MLSAREYVEITITRRLNKVRPDDLIVDMNQYSTIIVEIKGMMHKLAAGNKIPGFDSEDLEGFFCMSVHRTLRQGKYDPSKKAFCFFVKSFTNLVRDIVRMRNNCIKKHLDVDAMDEAVLWTEKDKLF